MLLAKNSGGNAVDGVGRGGSCWHQVEANLEGGRERWGREGRRRERDGGERWREGGGSPGLTLLYCRKNIGLQDLSWILDKNQSGGVPISLLNSQILVGNPGNKVNYIM